MRQLSMKLVVRDDLVGDSRDGVGIARRNEDRGIAPDLAQRRDVAEDQRAAGECGFENGAEVLRLVPQAAGREDGLTRSSRHVDMFVFGLWHTKAVAAATAVQ